MKKIFILSFAMLFAMVTFAQVSTSKKADKVSSPTTEFYKDIMATLLSEDFEGTFPPAGWSVTNFHSNPDSNWHQEDDGTGNLVAECLYSDASMMDEWLISPSLDLSAQAGVTLSFMFYTSYYWFVNPYNGANMFVKVSTDGGTNWSPEWIEEDYGTFENWTWYTVTLPLTAYEGQADVKIAFNYVGDDGAQFLLDNVIITETTNIAENESVLTIYPNPASDVVAISQNADVEIFNVYGQLIGSYQDVNTIDVTQLNSGLYIFRIRMEDKVVSKSINVVR